MIDPAFVFEEYLLHHAHEQEWCYLKDQMPNEVWMMLQNDLEGSIGLYRCSHNIVVTRLNARLHE